MSRILMCLTKNNDNQNKYPKKVNLPKGVKKYATSKREINDEYTKNFLPSLIKSIYSRERATLPFIILPKVVTKYYKWVERK